jgi:predicted nucleic acid-binding protein
MTVLLDSTVLVEITRNRAGSTLRELVDSGHTLAATAINITEIYAGMRPSEAQRTESLMARLVCYPMTAAIGERAGRLINSWARQGRTLLVPDAIIAATALEHDLTLMTANRRDFPMPELKFYPA